MRCVLAAPCCLLTLCCLSEAFAQAPVISPTMRQPAGYVQLQVVSGQLQLTPRQQVRTRSSSTSSGTDRREQMTVDLTAASPRVDYEQSTSQWHLAITARNQSFFRIVREARGTGTIVPFEFQQDEQGNLSFTWGAAESARRRRYSTLWHLLLVEGETARVHLVPLLEFFRPGWNLSSSVDRITEALFANANNVEALPRERWTQLVAQLTDSRYARRQQAERQLRSEGKSILSFLENFPDDELDFEQQHRIRRIRQSLARGDDSDAPESIAAWLGTDPRIWLALLNQADLARRQVAAKQLSRTLGEPVKFDAAATPEIRHQQIEALRTRLPERPPREIKTE